MRNVVIVAGCRTPIGVINGQFRNMTALDLTVPVMKELVKRAGENFKPEIIEDVIWGCNYQRTYKENNLARVAAVKAGLPESVPGITIHRNCTSSMSSIQFGYYQIKSGEADCIMAGGSDSMSNAPHMVFGIRAGKKFGNLELHDSMWDSLTNLGIGPSMGITAENIAEKYGISREDMDAYSYRSHKRAVYAVETGKLRDEIVPIKTIVGKNEIIICDDEGPRKDTSIEKLSKLKAIFKEGGKVTAGNSSGMNDASSGVILMEEEKAKELGLPIICSVKAVATTGLSPDYMGLGPISSTQKALKKAGLTIEDMDIVEMNEAFAAQCLACQRELGIDDEKINVNGSGISLGHPVGATGARLVVAAMYELMKTGGKYGLATLCAGGGMGTAVIIEMRR